MQSKSATQMGRAFLMQQTKIKMKTTKKLKQHLALAIAFPFGDVAAVPAKTYMNLPFFPMNIF